jgi:hypothetical protein
MGKNRRYKIRGKMTPQKALNRTARNVLYRPKAEKSGPPPGKFHVRSRHTKLFTPGASVPETGIYEVMHDQAHRETHEVVMHRGDHFPPCDQCNERVRFRVVRTAPYIFDDEDFVDE